MVSIKKLVYSLAVMMVALVAFSSCDKSMNEPLTVQDQPNSEEFIAPSTRAMASNGAFGWTYYPNPNASYSTSPTASVYPGHGGEHIGGYFRASLVDNYGSYSVKIERIDGSPFTEAGVAHIKGGSLYASSMGSAQIRVGDRSVYIPVSIPLNKNNLSKRGVLNIWSMIISGRARFFSYPIMIWTDPMFTSRSNDGELMGYADNVPIYKAVKPKVGFSSYQCVEFCRRYYSSVYGKNLNGIGDAFKWFDNAGDYGLVAYANGTKEPRVGDIVCWSGGPAESTSKLGHVAIIVEVGPGFVKIAHQNGRSIDAIGAQMSVGSDGKTLSNPLGSGFSVRGIIRRTN